MHSTTISDVIRERAERGLADLLLTLYDAGYSAGAGLACEAGTHPGLRDLITTIAQRHQNEVLALRAWGDGALLADELPGWLLAQRQQADVTEESRRMEGPVPVEGWPV